MSITVAMLSNASLEATKVLHTQKNDDSIWSAPLKGILWGAAGACSTALGAVLLGNGIHGLVDITLKCLVEHSKGVLLGNARNIPLGSSIGGIFAGAIVINRCIRVANTCFKNCFFLLNPQNQAEEK